MLALEVALLSNKGGRAHNEDACGHWHSRDELFCVLADGAGGHGGGSVASRLVVERMLQAFADQPRVDGPALAQLMRETSQQLIDAREANTDHANMYATGVSLVVDFARHRAAWAHAGDSRLYLLRDGHVHRQTRDHSLVQAMADAGLIAPEQMRSHPKRSELRSALGAEDAQLEVDDSGAATEVQAGDVFLLCSDGVWEHVSEAVLEQTLTSAASTHDWLAQLEQAVYAATQGRKSFDNYTALTVWVSAAP